MNSILVIVYMHLIGIDAFLDLPIIESYFQEKSVVQVSVIGCFQKYEKVQLAKALMRKHRKVSILNLNQANSITAIALQSTHEQISVVVDGDCEKTISFLQECGTYNLFDVKHHWLILSLTNNVPLLFQNTLTNLNADINVAVPENNNIFTIYDVYNQAYNHNGTLRFSKLGLYSQTTGWKAKELQSKYWIRKNMTGVNFKSIVVLPVAFNGTLTDYLANNENRQINTFNRFHARLMSFCRDYYNYSVDIAESKSWGYLISNSSFDGLVGALERKRVDFGYSCLFVREDRATVMEYGRLTWILRAAFIFRNPKAQASIEIFLKPLSWSIWLCTILMAIVIIFALRASLFYEMLHGVDGTHSKLDMSWSIISLNTLGAFCQQGIPCPPKLVCGRIVLFCLFTLSVIIYQFYSASIVSNLLQQPATLIRNVLDILLSTMKAGCEDILYNRDYFTYTTDVPSKQLYLKKILQPNNNSNFLSPADGLTLVRKGGYAFHVELATAYPIIRASFNDRAVCELREVQMYKTQPMHANFQKHSPFRDMIDTCLQRLAENGQLIRERNYWHPARTECIESSKSGQFGVGLPEFYPALMSIAVGILASLVILGFEHYWFIKQFPNIVYPFAN